MTRWMHAKETKSRTYMQWSAEPAEASSLYAVGTVKSVKCGLDCGFRFWDNNR